MKHAITSKKAYHETMVAVYGLMSKGEANQRKELNKLEAMAKAAEEYGDNVLGLKPAKKTTGHYRSAWGKRCMKVK